MRHLILVLLALLALPLAACGEDETSAKPAAASGAFPVTVEHKFGSTTVEEAP